MAKKDSYHHGNLREALLAAALQTLAEEGLDKLSLRGLAKQVGVSPTAVYSHFSDKTALLVDIKTEGFKRFTAHMRAELAKLGNPNPEEAIRGIGRAYIDFALRHRFLFDVIFSWLPDLERLTPECIDASISCESLVRAQLLELMRQQGHSPSEIQGCVATLSAWSLAHGVSMLLRSGCVDGAVYCEKWPEDFSSSNPARQAQMLEALFTIQLEGLKAAIGKIR